MGSSPKHTQLIRSQATLCKWMVVKKYEPALDTMTNCLKEEKNQESITHENTKATKTA